MHARTLRIIHSAIVILTYGSEKCASLMCYSEVLLTAILLFILMLQVWAFPSQTRLLRYPPGLDTQQCKVVSRMIPQTRALHPSTSTALPLCGGPIPRSAPPSIAYLGRPTHTCPHSSDKHHRLRATALSFSGPADLHGSAFAGQRLTCTVRQGQGGQGRSSSLVVRADADFYGVLGVSKDADKKAIKSAYR
jgi:hypothetical protein